MIQYPQNLDELCQHRSRIDRRWMIVPMLRLKGDTKISCGCFVLMVSVLMTEADFMVEMKIAGKYYFFVSR